MVLRERRPELPLPDASLVVVDLDDLRGQFTDGGEVLRSEAFLGAARVLLEGHVEMPVHLPEHGRSFLYSLDEKQVAIDGKKLRGTSPRITWSRDDYILRRT